MSPSSSGGFAKRSAFTTSTLLLALFIGHALSYAQTGKTFTFTCSLFAFLNFKVFVHSLIQNKNAKFFLSPACNTIFQSYKIIKSSTACLTNMHFCRVRKIKVCDLRSLIFTIKILREHF